MVKREGQAQQGTREKKKKGKQPTVEGVSAIVDSDKQEQLGGPVPAEIVGDRRDTLGKRLVIAGVTLLALFLLFTVYKGSAHTQRLADKAVSQNRTLITLTKSQADQLEALAQYTQDLRHVAKLQNRKLVKHGLHPVPLPKPPEVVQGSGGDDGTPSGDANDPRPNPGPGPTHHPGPGPKPSHRPSPHPTPSSTPNLICVPVIKKCIPDPTIGAFYGFLR